MLTLRRVRDAWQILRDGGLPLATPRSGVGTSAVELSVATRAAIASRPTGRDAEALAAWVFAWSDHWPTTFAAQFGADASSIIDWASRAANDDGRYIKLRRLAIENLALIL